MNLTQSLARKVCNYQSPESIGSRFRNKRSAMIKQMIEEIYGKHGRVLIVDVGGSEQYWRFLSQPYMDANKIWITIVNLNKGDVFDKKHFNYCQGNGIKMPMFPDNFFHLAHSNSVIEHLQPYEQIMFAHEINRIADSYYVQTPNFWFPVEPHFMCPIFHWLHVNLRTTILTLTSLGQYERQDKFLDALEIVYKINLLDKRRMGWIFPGAKIVHEKMIGLTKSLIAVKD